MSATLPALFHGLLHVQAAESDFLKNSIFFKKNRFSHLVLVPNQVLVLDPLCHVLECIWRPRVDLDGEEGDEGA